MALQGRLEGVLGAAWGGSLGWSFVRWIENWLRYIPDKTISAAVALAVLKYGFPLFERELIHGGASKRYLRDTWAAPVLLACLYLPIFIALLTADGYAGARFIAGGMAALRQGGPSDAAVREACAERAERCAQALKPVQREQAHDFGVAFALSLPFLLADFYRAAFNFFCVVYGFLLAVYLLRVAISQNLSVARR